MKIEIKNRWNGDIIVSGEYESTKDCLERNRGANLGDANLMGAKKYHHSHDFFQEIIRRQKVETFTDKEWWAIGQIIVHRLCWCAIKKRFNETALSVFKKLGEVGFCEFLEKYKAL